MALQVTQGGMSVTERCKNALKLLEAAVREEHGKSEVAKIIFGNLLYIDGKKPNAIEDVEILDTLATYLTLKTEDDVKPKVFFELFPIDSELSPESLKLLVNLSSLAICIGLAPVLELVALWLKVTVSRLYAASVYPPSNQSLYSIWRLLTTYVTSLVGDLVSIPGFTAETVSELFKRDTNILSNDHPLDSLIFLSPVFADAFLSGLCTVYGFQPTLVLTMLTSGNHPQPLGAALPPPLAPPSPVLQFILHWLRYARHRTRSHHHHGLSSTTTAAAWTNLDWMQIARRYKLTGLVTNAAASIDQVLGFCPPVVICLAWWTIFGLVSTSSSKQTLEKSGDEEVSTLLSDLHLELLQCLLESSVGAGAHRHAGHASAGPAGFTAWYLACSRKLERTRTDLLCLEALVACVRDVSGAIGRQQEDQGSTLGAGCDPGCSQEAWLLGIRLAEFLQIAWVTGRIRSLSSDEFHSLLTPLAGHKVIELIRSRHRR